MDPNVLNQIVGMVYVQKVRIEAWQEQDAQDPFAVYDALTPDEPTGAWLVAKRLPAALIHLLTARQNSPIPSSFAHRTSLTETAR